MTSRSPTPEVNTLTVLGWSGCPTTHRTEEWVREACREAGLEPPAMVVEYIETQAEAEEARFIGSPTFVWRGADLFPEPDEIPALGCRIYRRPDGRISPLPDPAEFAGVLRRNGIAQAAVSAES